MSVRDGVTVCEGVAEAVAEGVRVAVRVDVCEGVAEAVGVIDGVNVCEAVAVGEKVAVGCGLCVSAANAGSASPSPPVFGITTSASESSGCEDLHRRFGKLKAQMPITSSVAQITKALGFSADLPFHTN